MVLHADDQSFSSDDYILKLVISGSVSEEYAVSQVRRVLLNQINNESGEPSFEKLKQLVYAIVLPEDDNLEGVPEISFTYHDIDDDCVALSSTEELIDAIEQFKTERLIRVNTEIRPRITDTTEEEVRHECLSRDLGEDASGGEHPVTEVGFEEERSVEPRTIIGSISQAVSNLVRGDAPTPEATGSRPFIHGRHFCDSCTVGPIIGKRFHAVNWDNFDLCESCRNAYIGSDIDFEEIELECDRLRQAEWNRGNRLPRQSYDMEDIAPMMTLSSRAQ